MIVPILYGNFNRTGFEQESSQKDVTITVIVPHHNERTVLSSG